ncbi:transcription antitermination factor NusB [Oscillospiraceae bacterium OttesenSCG-928-F05]|nr:transcription antitermination factor NusB [Oscillospiraceae bacterium OttesenSCG-928-F05]
MDRITAREMVCRIVFECGYNAEDAEKSLNDRLSPEGFAALRGEDDVYSAFPSKKQEDYIRRVVEGVLARAEELDGYIAKYALGWQLNRVSRMSVAILRVCMYEVLYMEDIPDNAAINAAIDIGKLYLDDDGSSFIHGVLGAFFRGEKEQS